MWREHLNKCKVLLDLHASQAAVAVEKVGEVALLDARHVEVDNEQRRAGHRVLTPLLLPPLDVSVRLHPRARALSQAHPAMNAGVFFRRRPLPGGSAAVGMCCCRVIGQDIDFAQQLCTTFEHILKPSC